ncbi:MAG: 4Fe-4S dicluster domain-containing protein, partial [Planctomycetaceae bacterium]|nr:4Fe-4S dicluster domain-containing protein [Planctomycetaceae bacterium]
MKFAGAALGLAAFGKAISPLMVIPEDVSAEEFLQQHYKELTDEDKERIFARLETETKEQYGADVTISDPPPIPGVRFGYAINLSKCNGNGKCMEACNEENNHHRGVDQSYIRVLEMSKGSMDMAQGTTTYDHTVPQDDKFYLPIQCQQCEDPPCVSVCPIEATWQEEDGIVVVDYNWCIGCRYCMAACPYDARRFNFEKPKLDPHQINPEQGYLSNRIRPKGVVEKCTFCLHRTREGIYPACLEVCPVGARVFGNILDPESEINYILQNKRVYVLK